MSGYMTEYLRLPPDLYRWGLFPNAKELTESFGAYAATRKHVPFALNDPSVVCLCVGDGRRPRTGMTFVTRSAWRVMSIDPLMRAKNYRMERLSTHCSRIQDFEPIHAPRVVIVLVHAHVTVPDALLAVADGAETYVVAMPCCVPQTLPTGLLLAEYVDTDVLSPCRTIRVWRV